MNSPSVNQPNVFAQSYYFVRTYWPVFLAVMVLNLAIGTGLQWVAEYDQFPKLVNSLAGLMGVMWTFWVNLAVIYAIHRISSGGDAHIKKLFEVSLQRIAEFIFLQIAFLFLIFVGLSFFIVPGLYIFYRCVFINYVFVAEEKGMMDSFRESFELTTLTSPNQKLLIAPLIGVFILGTLFVFWLRPDTAGEPKQLSTTEMWSLKIGAILFTIYFNTVFYRIYSLIKSSVEPSDSNTDEPDES